MEGKERDSVLSGGGVPDFLSLRLSFYSSLTALLSYLAWLAMSWKFCPGRSPHLLDLEHVFTLQIKEDRDF